jgi:hypothetical protein
MFIALICVQNSGDNSNFVLAIKGPTDAQTIVILVVRNFLLNNTIYYIYKFCIYIRILSSKHHFGSRHI